MMRLHAILLRLYPSGFRREYGPELAALFEESVARTSRAGGVVLLLRAAADIAVNATRLHLELLGQDLRYTWRTLRAAPGFALTAVLVTALAVGANTAAFSVADFVLIRPFTFPEPESLVRLCAGPREGPVGWGCMNQLSPAQYRDLKERTESFSSLGAFMGDAVNLTGGGEPQRVASAEVTTEVFPLLGVRPFVGSWLDDGVVAGGSGVVVLSHGLWRAQFGADANVIGEVVSLDGAPFEVIGVMPPGFHFPSRDAQLWTPLVLVEEDYVDRGNNYLEGVGRLAGGVTFERARADLDAAVEELAAIHPDAPGVSFFRMSDGFSPRYRLMLQALCGAGLCILLLACANLANLLLARAGSRERELAVRTVLGAGRERLARQMLTESVVLAAMGGAAGVVVSLVAMPLLSLMVPSTLPIGAEPHLNLRLFLLAALFTALTGLGFGVVPALRVGGDRSFEVLRGRAARSKRRLRSALVAVEVAVSVVLLVASGLLIRAMLRVEAIDSGFREEGVLTLRTVLPKPEYATAESRERFYREVLGQVRLLPGVQSAAYTSGLPMVMTGGIAVATVPGQEVRPDDENLVSRRYVTPQFFAALGIPLLAGRDFEDADGAGDPVAVVSASFAERYWPGQDALGRSFLFRDELRTIIGVVGDIRVRGLERTSEPQLYLPSSHVNDSFLTFYDPKDLVIRTNVREATLLPAIREIIRRADPDQPISDVMTLSELLATQTAPRRAQVRVLAALAALALLLAGLGIHGLLAYTVSQQRHDIAVRLALGEERSRVARRVVRDGLSIVLLGLVPGLLVAIAAASSLRSLLFGVPTLDPATIVLTLGVCIAVSITGAWLPARRAVRVSPMAVMRSDT